MTTTTLNRPRLGSETVTNGVRIVVQPAFSALESDPNNNYFKFVYRIRIANESDRAWQLISRHWVIVDADGEKHALPPLEAGNEAAGDPRRGGLREEHLEAESDHDHAHECGDHRLEPPEPVRLQGEDAEGGGARDERRGEER